MIESLFIKTDRSQPIRGVSFHGEVASSNFIDGISLASAIGLTQGTAQFSNEPWLKFELDNKTLYVAKKSQRYGVSWNAINACGAIYGSRTIEVAGKVYKVRVLKGVSQDPPAYAMGASTFGHENTWGSEWNRLLYRVFNGVSMDNHGKNILDDEPVIGDLANYTEAELHVNYSNGNGTDCWCQETLGSNRICRGSYGISHLYLMTPDVNRPSYGWRPVLELVN